MLLPIAGLLLTACQLQGPCEVAKARSFGTWGHCCFEGQTWQDDACRGTPASCPEGFVLEGDACTLPAPEGMVSIPGGPFLMGCNRAVDDGCRHDSEQPLHTVVLPSFFIDETEVTVSAYAACVEAGACTTTDVHRTALPDDRKWDKFCTWNKREAHPDNPMCCLDWNQAKAFCAWKGKRLPTDQEWEKAARGTDGRRYPWGNQGFESTLYANIDNLPEDTYQDGVYGTSAVGKFPKGVSPYGAHDMGGNVYEWTSTLYQADPPHPINRGGAWDSRPREVRASARNSDGIDFRFNNVGVRCAKSP